MKKPRLVQWSSLNTQDRKSILKRPEQTQNEGFSEQVRRILKTVQTGGDSALFQFTRDFDGLEVQSLRVSKQEIRDAYAKVPVDVVTALKEATRRISLFHRAQLPQTIEVETGPGVRCQQKFVPIDCVGLYVPAGTAPLASTMLMIGVPSLIAGCNRRILLTPPQTSTDGEEPTVNPTILVAADLVGIEEIYKVGGAQAIAAMAYGTESIPKVDKIFGPGNSWVTEAKIQVSRDRMGAAIDMPAGPSEVMVIADLTGNPAFIAADLLAQAEHGTDSQALFVCTSSKMIAEVREELEKQIESLPRKEIAAAALANSSFIEVPDLESAIQICNEYAPEHLILQVENPNQAALGVRNAGSIFLGVWTPESMGDYASGTNHVLPTYGYAKTLGGLTTGSFMKSITLQEVTLSGLRSLGPTVETLAQIERLEAHKNAVSLRLRKGIL